MEGSNPTGSSPVHGFRDRSPTIQRHLPICQRTWWPRRDSNPHCSVSKTDASCQLGYPAIGALRRNRTDHERLCRPPPNHLAFSAKLEKFTGRDNCNIGMISSRSYREVRVAFSWTFSIVKDERQKCQVTTANSDARHSSGCSMRIKASKTSARTPYSAGR